MSAEVLSDSEVEAVIFAFMRARRSRTFTEDEARKVLDWAVDARLSAAALKLAIEGRMNVDVREDGEIIYSLNKV